LYPALEKLRQVRQVIDQLDKPHFQVRNGRNYYGILPFLAETSRNATQGCILQSARWLRGLVQAPPGWGLIYADYVAEEIYIAAILSGDGVLQRAYDSGDPYIFFGQLAGLIPAGGTKHSHPHERELAKTLMLATGYGMGVHSLAIRLNVSLHRAQSLREAHQRGFRVFWGWSDEVVRSARWRRQIDTMYGWSLAVTQRTKENTLRDFPAQATGAEILRLAGCLLWEAGIEVCAPVHDAVLVQAPKSDLVEIARETCRCMERASEIVLKGHRLRTEARILGYPERMLEPRGEEMWNKILGIERRLLEDAA
jgi:DNA polymerase I-like protein with 3'-5' exonuclease and polymerase domains